MSSMGEKEGNGPQIQSDLAHLHAKPALKAKYCHHSTATEAILVERVNKTLK